MKKFIITAGILILSGYTGVCQIPTQDKLALEIPQANTYSTNGISSYVKEHFSSDSNRVRALFVWVSNNISYDVEKLRAKNQQGKATINDVLKTRKAVCQGYSELFVALCNECNIRAIFVPGYTKLPNGSLADLSHAWVAAEINKKWYLFDPTWAAGSVKDYQFTRNFSNRYYNLLPEEMIKDHMPFDPMYQFMNYPFMYDEFNKGSTSINTSKPFFNYADTISLYNSLDTLNQFISSARRINRNGEKNQMIYEMVQVLNKNQQSGESKIGFDEAATQFKQAINLFNRYIDYKNKRFSSIKNEEIQQMIDSVLLHIKTAYSMLAPVISNSEENKRALQNINSDLSKFYARVEEENTFLKTYLQNGKAVRK